MITELDAFGTFPIRIGTAISPHVIVIRALTQAIAPTSIGRCSIGGATHAEFVTAVAWLVNVTLQE